ncbi:MAG: YfiR family protein [Mariprofundus sp.]|nr:YfiR family protein [Mariprofundus sp.]
MKQANMSDPPPQAERAWLALLCYPALLLLLLMPLASSATAADTQEDELKAALIYKLTRFISWPLQAEGEDLNICVTGEHPLGGALEEIRSKRSNDRTIRIQYLSPHESLDGCQLLFLSNDSPDSVSDMVTRLGDRPIVSLSDSHSFAKKGGMIEITRRNHRYSFTINMQSVTQSGVKIAAPLLQISKLIRSEP